MYNMLISLVQKMATMLSDTFKSKAYKYNQVHTVGIKLLKSLADFVSKAVTEDRIAHIKITLEGDGEFAFIKMFGRQFLVGFHITHDKEPIGHIILYKSEKRSDNWLDYSVPIKTKLYFDKLGYLKDVVSQDVLEDFEHQLNTYYNIFNEQNSSEKSR